MYQGTLISRYIECVTITESKFIINRVLVWMTPKSTSIYWVTIWLEQLDFCLRRWKLELSVQHIANCILSPELVFNILNYRTNSKKSELMVKSFCGYTIPYQTNNNVLPSMDQHQVKLKLEVVYPKAQCYIVGLHLFLIHIYTVYLSCSYHVCKWIFYCFHSISHNINFVL